MKRNSPLSSGHVHAPAANTAAVVTIDAAGAGVCNVVGNGLAWSYSDDPTGGNLKIEDGAGNTVFSMDITSRGAGFIPLDVPLRGSPNTALVVTLAAGGAGISGKVNVLAHWTN